MVREKIKHILERAIGQQGKIDYPIVPENGDYSTNLIMSVGLNGDEAIAKLTEYLRLNANLAKIFEKVELKDGFMNFFLSPEFLQNQVQEIIKQGEKFGSIDIGKK